MPDKTRRGYIYVARSRVPLYVGHPDEDCPPLLCFSLFLSIFLSLISHHFYLFLFYFFILFYMSIYLSLSKRVIFEKQSFSTNNSLFFFQTSCNLA